MAYCQVPTPFCPPQQQEKKSKCPNCGLPISLVDGNTSIEQTDVRLPGLGGGLVLTRTWNSIWPSTQANMAVGIFGNWRTTFEEAVFLGGHNYVKYARSDGDFWSFGYWAGEWIPAVPANAPAYITADANSWWLTFPQTGETRRFDFTTRKLISISDRNGNTTQIAYDSSNRLYTVTDPGGRTLTFTYASPSSYLVTGVSSSVGGLSLTYSYDNQGRLTQVTNPDLSTINYTYNAQSLITSVTDSQGKVLESHTYDSAGRGLTSSRANGVESLTITYQ
jgi:YD repeat-containing protein